MSYSVLSGDLEYHAAARAKQLNPRAGEMVAAFVAKPAPEPTIGEMLEDQKAGADGPLPRSEQLKGEGVILGTAFLTEDYQSDEPGAKIIKELRIREIDRDNFEDFRYSTRFNEDRFVPFVLESRFVRETDAGRDYEKEWQPLSFAHSEDELLDTSSVDTIDSVVDPKLQTKRDEDNNKKTAAESALNAQKAQKEADHAEHQDWLNTHAQAQYQATKGKKDTISIPLVAHGGREVSAEVNATVYDGLAVHKSIRWLGYAEKGEVAQAGGYTITHVASGKKLHEVPTLEEARRIAAVFSHEINWQDDIASMPSDELDKGREIMAALKEKRKPNFIDLTQSPTIREKSKLRPKKK
jgi:hypothetical protein